MNAARIVDPEAPWIPLSDPDVTQAELDAVAAAVCSPCLSLGPGVEAFEAGPGDEVIATSYSWRECVHAVALAGRAADRLHRLDAEGCIGQRRRGYGHLPVTGG